MLRRCGTTPGTAYPRLRNSIAAATRDVDVGKAGFERYVALAARQHGFLYGLAAVLLSLGLGWAAAMVFRRRV